MAEVANLKKLSEFKDKSLLIVDDDNPFRERLARAMEKKGFQVSQAEGVKKGIEAVKIKKPAFAVVDLRLNDGNGLEVVKEIQNSNSNSRIIMLTGYGNISTAVAAIKQGAFDYLAKPADADDVEKAFAKEVKDQTGYSIGGVPPVAHKTTPNQIFIDLNLKRFEKIYAAAGHPYVVFGITFEQICQITNGNIIDFVE